MYGIRVEYVCTIRCMESVWNTCVRLDVWNTCVYECTIRCMEYVCTIRCVEYVYVRVYD